VKKKLCFILPIYVEETDRHFNHIYDFLSLLAEKVSLSLVFEAGEPTDRKLNSETENFLEKSFTHPLH